MSHDHREDEGSLMTGCVVGLMLSLFVYYVLWEISK